MNFITLFDHNYLPQGIALYRSLENHCKNFKLFVLCLNELVYKQLELFNLKNMNLLKLSDYETPELLRVKKDRSIAEYCWTLSSHTYKFAKMHTPELEEITYVDTDLFFFKNPAILTGELDKTSKSVLITEHAFGPEYQQYEINGKYCVQFLPVRFNAVSEKILAEWQNECIEWCYFRNEDGKYGDQKYLEKWPIKYSEEVHVLEQKCEALAPWNIQYYLKEGCLPVFYHFHNFRFIGTHKARCFHNYYISKNNQRLYKEYYKVLQDVLYEMDKLKIPRPFFKIEKKKFQFLRDFKNVNIDQNLMYLKFK